MPTSPSSFDVIVVGGGPAGLMATLVAARRGASVLLLERMAQPGLKLRLTGKGRCNLTNMAPIADFLRHVGPDARFLRNAFGRFFNRELCAFVEQLGVPLQEERGKRIFPASGKSLDVFLAFVQAIEALPNVVIRRNARVADLLIGDSRKLQGVRLADGTAFYAQSVVLATGGITYPTTGSTGDGYRLAAQAGHTIVEPVAALSPLTCDWPFSTQSEKAVDQHLRRDWPFSTQSEKAVDQHLHRDWGDGHQRRDWRVPAELQGFTLKNVSLSITEESGRKLYEQMGELTFTADGIGGPIALSASRVAARRLHDGERLKAIIDLKPALNMEQLDRRLISDLNANGTRLWHDALRLWLPAELVETALRRLKIAKFKRLHQINAEERHRLLKFLKGFDLCVTGCHGVEESLVTQGGVDTSEVNPKTMESKLLQGLYVVGELLNLDADTGGYNLQIAFSTGYVCGTFAHQVRGAYQLPFGRDGLC